MDKRQIVKDFVSTWSDQKIAEVFAFNQDGKMIEDDPCCCLLGVHSSIILHQFNQPCHPTKWAHYSRLLDSDMKKFCKIERAYIDLSSDRNTRNRVFGEILSEVMVEREAALQNAPERERVAI